MRRLSLLTLLTTTLLASTSFGQTPPTTGDQQQRPPMNGQRPPMGNQMGQGGPGGQIGGQQGGQPGGDHPPGPMADTNQDGSISREEFIAAAPKHFEEMDRNHDGKLTPDEMPPHPGMGDGQGNSGENQGSIDQGGPSGQQGVEHGPMGQSGQMNGQHPPMGGTGRPQPPQGGHIGGAPAATQ